jgi:hypothetical protein
MICLQNTKQQLQKKLILLLFKLIIIALSNNEIKKLPLITIFNPIIF